MKTNNDALERRDNGKLLRKVAVELAMGFMKQALEIEKATWYPRVGHTVYSLWAS